MRLAIPIVCLLVIFQPCLAQERTEPIIQMSIFFGGGSYYVDVKQAEDLRELMESIKDLEMYEIYIHGHTDNIGSIEYNQWLSDMRTDQVIQKIIQNGIDKEVIYEQDFGELNPVYDNNTWEGKLMNRRVDIIFKKPET